MESKHFRLNSSDWKRVLKNALVFLAPAMIIFLTAMQNGVPMQQALYSVYLWGLNTSIDLLRKFVDGK